MKKDEVYKLIEYNGIYNETVRKNLKNLIKKYHPDKKNGDTKIIEVIYDVKKELESGKISYNPFKKENKKTKQPFLSKEECLINIERLKKEESINQIKIEKEYAKLSKLFKEYSISYEKNCELRNVCCDKKDKLNLLKKTILMKLLIFLIIFVLVIINLIKFNLVVILIILVLCICLKWMLSSIKLYKINNLNYKKNKQEEIKNNLKIEQIRTKINELDTEIRNLEREKNKIKNDIRFYKNMQINKC